MTVFVDAIHRIRNCIPMRGSEVPAALDWVHEITRRLPPDCTPLTASAWVCSPSMVAMTRATFSLIVEAPSVVGTARCAVLLGSHCLRF
jgi:hypothetical protein